MYKTSRALAEHEREIARFRANTRKVLESGFVAKDLWTVYTALDPTTMSMEKLLQMVSPETRAVIHAAADIALPVADLKICLEILRDDNNPSKSHGLAKVWHKYPELQDGTMYHFHERT